MILTTRVSLQIGQIVSGFTRKELKKSVQIYYCCNRITNCSRGYVVTRNIGRTLDSVTTRTSELLFRGQIIEFPHNRLLSTEEDLKSISFEKISNETLESLTEYFDELIEEANHLQDADVSSGDGVLTIKFGKEYGTYVINRQVPNQQIWLSSPKSGPKRYDFIDDTWIYKHDGKSLHELLNEEIPEIVNSTVSFDKCSYGTRRK